MRPNQVKPLTTATGKSPHTMKFAEIVRSSQQVRGTFERVSGLAFWWRVVLALHGKPLAAAGTEEARLATLVRGFRFYGYLYLGLGTLLLLGAAAWLVAFGPSPWYWIGVAGFGALYLFGIGSYLIELLYLIWWKSGP